MVEASASRSRHVRDYAIHHLPALLIGVEVLIDKVPQKAPALRDSYGVSALYRRCCLRIIFQVRKEIAHRGQTYADNRGIFRRIDEFINPARNKSAVQMNVM